MKIKIGNKIYDSSKQIIMITLDETEQKDLGTSIEDYCSYPKGTNPLLVRKFMRVESEKVDETPKSIPSIIEKFELDYSKVLKDKEVKSSELRYRFSLDVEAFKEGDRICQNGLTIEVTRVIIHIHDILGDPCIQYVGTRVHKGQLVKGERIITDLECDKSGIELLPQNKK